jgi:prepilin-type N-terminal cleavage/methylation domain-containing protein
MPRTLRLPRSKRTYARLAFPARPANTRNAGGFTLIELLVVMMIIAILASMVSFAMFRAQQTARKAATQALITKLHTVIARQWDTYATRRIQWETPAGTSNMDPEDAAQFKLAALRQLMRLELPNRWADVSNDVTALNNTNFPYIISPETPPTLALPALTQAYQAYSTGGTAEHQNAECLYMIVSMIADHDLDRINLFSEDEVGDVDGDGKNEFIDAWDNPIRFLRWPMGFVDKPDDPAWGHLSDLQTADSAGSPDPFDPRGVDTRGTWAIYPLLYAAGPDQTYDIYTGTGSSDDPYAGIDQNHDPLGTNGTQIGAPLDASNDAQVAPDNGKLNHHDNIHNHHLGGSLR